MELIYDDLSTQDTYPIGALHKAIEALDSYPFVVINLGLTEPELRALERFEITEDVGRPNLLSEQEFKLDDNKIQEIYTNSHETLKSISPKADAEVLNHLSDLMVKLAQALPEGWNVRMELRSILPETVSRSWHIDEHFCATSGYLEYRFLATLKGAHTLFYTGQSQCGKSPTEVARELQNVVEPSYTVNVLSSDLGFGTIYPSGSAKGVIHKAPEDPKTIAESRLLLVATVSPEGCDKRIQ